MTDHCVINSHLHPILHRFQVLADHSAKLFASDRGTLQFNALADGDTLRISTLMICFGLHFCRRKFSWISHFYA